MGILDVFGNRERTVILDVAMMDSWPDRLIRQQRLDAAFRDYVASLEQSKAAVNDAKDALADPRAKRSVPERALPVYDEHVPVMLAAVDRLLAQAQPADDLYEIDERQAEFQTALTHYRERTQKAVAALNDFLGHELKNLNMKIRGLEDRFLAITPRLEEARFANIRNIRTLIQEYRASREKERKLKELKDALLAEIDALETKKQKIKERIRHLSENARNPKYKELIAEEESLVERSDTIKVKGLPEEEEERQLQPIKQRLAFIRKQMINDITAMNINEQRTFLESVKDELRLHRRKLERVDELLTELGYETFRLRLSTLLEPFDAKIEEADEITETEEDNVAPQ